MCRSRLSILLSISLICPFPFSHTDLLSHTAAKRYAGSLLFFPFYPLSRFILYSIHQILWHTKRPVLTFGVKTGLLICIRLYLQRMFPLPDPSEELANLKDKLSDQGSRSAAGSRRRASIAWLRALAAASSSSCV